MSIPQKIRASTALEQRAHYVGKLAMDSLPRLAEVLGPEGVFQVDLQFGHVAGHARVSGRVTGAAVLSCRSCGQDYSTALDCQVDLRLVQSDAEAQQVLHDCDPYQVQDDTLPLQELVEDEVLLALPLLPRCNSCENAKPDAPQAQSAEVRRVEAAAGPFAVLKTLKIDGRH
ncbi:MAG: YceD family protein [Stenotrophobium sp.]